MKSKLYYSFTLMMLSLWIMPISTVLADGGHDDEAATSSGFALPVTALISIVFIVGAIFLANEDKIKRYGLLSAVLAVITGAIHLNIGLNGDTLLLLNGLGYFGLLAALYLPLDVLTPFRKWTRIALIIYTFVTIVAYVATHPPAYMSTVGIFDKVVEVLLIGTLLLDRKND